MTDETTDGESNGVGTDAETRGAALATEIAETLAPDDWDEAKIAALADDLRFGVQWHLAQPADAENRRREKLKQARGKASARTKIFQTAAKAVHEEPSRVGQMLWLDDFKGRGYPYPPAPPPDRPTDWYVLQCDLYALAKAERAAAAACTEELRRRSHSDDDALVHWIWQILAQHELAHTAHVDPRSGYATGHIVTACAMIRGEQPVKALWVVKATERISAQQRDPMRADSRLGPRKRSH